MIDVSPSARYAMDGGTPVRHVVTVLGGALRPLSLAEMAATYDHPVPSDFHRIKLHEHCSNDTAARIWLMRYAIAKLGPEQIEQVEDDTYRLKLPVAEIRHEGKPVAPYEKEKPHFEGGSRPFDPMSGLFSDNIRAKSEVDDLTELRESMRELGWVDAFPAIIDERGVVLVGHRRLKVAAELGIKPKIFKVTLGTGKAADVMRLKLALASNIGYRPMTPASRKRIAAYLYDDQGWSMQKIGQALRVSHKTISLDLEDARRTLGTMRTPGIQPPRRDTLGRPASPGRTGGKFLERTLRILADHPEGLTLQELATLADRDPTGISRHRLLLTALSLVEQAGTKKGRGPNPMAVWRVTEAGKAELENPTVLLRPEDVPPDQVQEPPLPIEPLPPAEEPNEHVCVCPICGAQHNGR